MADEGAESGVVDAFVVEMRDGCEGCMRRGDPAMGYAVEGRES
jgi:hypothetical protein